VNSGSKFFADELEKLLGMPLETRQDLEAWHFASKRLRETITSQHPDVDYEGETYHFLADAKIRQRDPDYRKWQEGEVRRYIEMVRAQR
jgi:hypothetical protein